MSFADRLAAFIYRIATTGGKLKIIITPVGITFWFGLSALFVFASLWLDKSLPVRLLLPMPVFWWAEPPGRELAVRAYLWGQIDRFRFAVLAQAIEDPLAGTASQRQAAVDGVLIDALDLSLAPPDARGREDSPSVQQVGDPLAAPATAIV